GAGLNGSPHRYGPSTPVPGRLVDNAGFMVRQLSRPRPDADVTASAVMCAGLTKDYGSGHGVFDLDLGVRQGETFGFIGPNGAGKTTTIRLLMDLIRPDRGSATVLGLDSR